MDRPEQVASVLNCTVDIRWRQRTSREMCKYDRTASEVSAGSVLFMRWNTPHRSAITSFNNLSITRSHRCHLISYALLGRKRETLDESKNHMRSQTPIYNQVNVRWRQRTSREMCKYDRTASEVSAGSVLFMRRNTPHRSAITSFNNLSITRSQRCYLISYAFLGRKREMSD